jgi:pilus assembly protein CpaC
VPQLNYPEKFLPPNSNIPMTTPTTPVTPGASMTGVKPPATIPVEQLIQSMQPEKPLTTDGGYSSGGYGQGSTDTSMSSTPSTTPH